MSHNKRKTMRGKCEGGMLCCVPNWNLIAFWKINYVVRIEGASVLSQAKMRAQRKVINFLRTATKILEY